MAQDEEEMIERLRRQHEQRGKNNPRVAIANDEEEALDPFAKGVPPAPQPRQPPHRQDMEDIRVGPRQRRQEPPQEQHRPMQHQRQERPTPPPPARQNGQESQQRSVPPRFEAQPFTSMPDQSGAPARTGLIDRGSMADRYGIAFGLFGLVCELQSLYTTIIGVYYLWGIMFDETRLAYLFGFIIAFSIFLGEIFNSDFHEVVVDEDDEPHLVEVPNRMRNYYLWLTPDAGFTMLFWLAPFVRMFVYIFFHTKVGVTNVQGVAELLGQAWVGQTWGIFLAFFFLCLLPATALSAAWSVVSAYYPEKALLGPRMRDAIKQRVMQLAQLQGAVRM